MTMMTKGMFVTIAVVMSVQVTSITAAAQQPSSPPAAQPCADGTGPTPEQKARRSQGVRLTRTINNLQVNQPGARDRKFLRQQDLGTSPFAARQTGEAAEFIRSLNFTPGAELLLGWVLTLDVTPDGYWFMIEDKTACGLRFISNQKGIIFEAAPLR